jgi:subtilase family serine protease
MPETVRLKGKSKFDRDIPLMLAVFVVALFLLLPSFHSHTGIRYSPSDPYIIPDFESGVISGLSPIAAENPSLKLNVMVSLQYSNQGELDNFLVNLQNPSSPVYHHYLTAKEFIDTYSPSSSEYYRYVNYFIFRGFSVTTYADRVSIDLSGSVGQFENLFGTTINVYSIHNGTFYAPSSTLSLPVNYGDISSVVGLSDQFTAHIAPLFQVSGSSESLYGSDFQNAYHLSSLYQKYGYPTNETIATILWSGTNSSGQSVAPYVPADIQHYISNNIPSSEPRAKIYYYNFSGAPAPGPSAVYDVTNADIESTLDLEMAASLAPGASIVEVYGPQPKLSYLDEAFANILNPSYNSTVNSALKNVSVISNSWGTNDTTNTLWSQYEEEAAARGITVFASSGDDGNSPSYSPSFPASSAYNGYGTIAVGGTFTTLTGTASDNGTGTTGIETQSVWYNLPNPGNGTQGGVSAIYPEPSWQLDSPDASNVISSSSSLTSVSSGRGTPDLSGDGANMSIYISTSSGGYYATVDGTSIASPLVAAEFSVIDHSLGKNVGFVEPALYKMGNAEYNGSYQVNPPFYFVYNGSNHVFSALKGYSLVTGWGSLNAYNFFTDYSHPGKALVNFTESGLPSGTEWNVNISGHNISSVSTFITVNLSFGNYTYTIGNSLSYHEYPASGILDLTASVQNITVYFKKPSIYEVIFKEHGLPQGSLWIVYINGTKISSNTPSIIDFLKNGTYTYIIGILSGYQSTSAGGTFKISGNNVTINVSFLSFQTTANFVLLNYSSPVPWHVIINGTIQGDFYSNSSNLTVPLSSGMYTYQVILGDGNVTPVSSGHFIISGSSVTIYVNLSYSPRDQTIGLIYGISILSVGLIFVGLGIIEVRRRR